MKPRTTTRVRSLAALSTVAALALAACGGDDDDSADAPTPTAPPATDAPPSSEAPAGGIDLSADCPELISIQTDWMPEAEHGFLYQMVGEPYELDPGKAYVTGPLIDSDGNDTGVDIQVRSGGPPQQFQPVTLIMYTGDAFLGYVYTDEAIQFSGSETPTMAIMSGFEKNPQIIMWDPETYPDVETIADLGEAGVKVRYFGGAAYMDYFTASGILDPAQVDGSYSGDPSLFIADEGKAAQQGFGSAEPYLYEYELADWMKPVKYQYINDAGWENYAESIATKPENIETYSACFEKLVPIIQQASIDFLNDPAHGMEVILAASESFGENFGWTYTAAAGEYAVETMRADGLVANGPDGVMGKFDMDRVAGLIELAVPVYEAQGASPKEGVTPEDIVTNQFIDETIGL